MPIARFQMPDGRIGRFEVPDGTTPEQAQQMILSSLTEQPKAPTAADDMTPMERRVAGAGLAAAKAGRAAKQGLDMLAVGLEKRLPFLKTLGEAGNKYLGMPTSDQALADTNASIEDAKATDAALLATREGRQGSIAGNIGVAVPTMLLPGGQSLAGSMLYGGALSAATQEGELEDRLKAGAMGSAGAGAGYGVGKLLGYGASKVGTALKNANAARQAANASRDLATAEARSVGYVVPPSQANPTTLNRVLEGAAGKLTTAQQASLKNQSTTNKLVARSLGLSEGEAITPELLNAIRKNAGQAYEAVASTGTVTPGAAYSKALDDIVKPYARAAKSFPNAKPNPILSEIESLRSPQFDAADAISKIKVLRADADAAYISGNKELGRALKSGAQALEDALDDHLQKIGAPSDMLNSFRDARQVIAKTYTVEKALNMTTGNVNAQALGKQLAKGKPLSGDLAKVARFSQAYPKAAREITESVPGISPLDFAFGAGAGVATGSPLPALYAAMRPGIRSAILSDTAQGLLVSPSYGSRMGGLLSDPRALTFIQRAAPFIGMASVHSAEQ